MSSTNPGEQRRQSQCLSVHRARLATLNLRALLEPHGEHAVTSSMGTRPRHDRGLSFLVLVVLHRHAEMTVCFPGLTETQLPIRDDVTAARHDFLLRIAPYYLISSIIPLSLTELAFKRMLPKCKLPRR